MKKIITETKTVIINTRTNEQFASYEESINVGLDGSSHTVITLSREDGTKKEVSMATFKRWYKSTEIQVETEIEVDEPKIEKPIAETKHQQASRRNIRGAYTFVLGGYENSIQDGQMSEMPSVESLFREVYDESMNSGHEMLGGIRIDGGPAPVCMRFAGKAFVKKYIAYLFSEDGYEVPEALYNAPERKVPSHTRTVEIPEHLAEDEVIMRAFTGMFIGVFKITEKTDKVITVQLADGSPMEFDANTGKELNAGKPQFANKLDM